MLFGICGIAGMLLLVLVVVVVLAISIYNKLIRLKNLADEGWSGIDVQLKRRYDLIPNIVETVKGYAKHEKQTLEDVVKLRNSAMALSNPNEKVAVEEQLSQSLKSVFALAESYPELKANENFKQLQENLDKVEDDLQNARRYYNGTVRELNTAVETFPTSLFAGVFNVKKRAFFEAEGAEKDNVKVEF